MTRPWIVPALSLLLLASTVALAQVEFVVESYIVSKVTRDDGTREDRYSPTTEGARPGQVVEFRIIATNESEETLPPGIVAISVPIPEGTQFVPHSATPSSEDLLTEFSADNVTFSETHVFVGLGDNRTIADPTAYTWVRWTVLVDMEPGAELTLVFRATMR